MKRFLTIFIFSGVLMGNVYANETHSIKVHVEGMVCAFCAQGIEKRISNIPGVLSVEVDLKPRWYPYKRVHPRPLPTGRSPPPSRKRDTMYRRFSARMR